MFRYLSAVSILLLSGCATVQTIEPATREKPIVRSEHRVDTTYELGARTQAFVGERMLRVQDYYETIREAAAGAQDLTPTESFSMRIPPLTSVSLSPTDTLTVVGTTDRGGESYRLVSIPGPTTRLLRFLITEDGAFEGSAVNHSGARMGWSYTPSPESVRLIPAASKTSIDTRKGFTNFELVYSGTTKDSLQLLYREYTQGDLARPAFSQTLVYEKDSSAIRFRNLQIEVHSASNERIEFTVVSDQ